MNKFENIRLTTGTEDSEPWRIERLYRVIGYFFAVSEFYGCPESILNISELCDNKGALIVYWNTPPSSREEDFFTDAWKSEIGGGLGAGAVCHIQEEDKASERTDTNCMQATNEGGKFHGSHSFGR